MPKTIKRTKSVVGKDEKYENSKFFMLNGVDLEKRTISIYDDIDQDSAAFLVRGLKKMIEVSREDPIDVEINSPGGDTYCSFAMFDAIKDCPCTVRTFAQGHVMSAGFTIYLAGDERYSYPHTTFMAHSGHSRTWGKEFEQHIDVQELKRLNEKLFELYAEETNMGRAWWKRKLKTHDLYFDYDKAMELGVVTHEIAE